MKPPQNRLGFTIVELLIVIVVIAILAAISLVAYTGIQVKAQNTARISELNQWEKLFELHRAAHGSYPDMPRGPAVGASTSRDGYYCLGTSFPLGTSGVSRCRNYQAAASSAYTILESGNSNLMSALKEFGTLPQGSHVPIEGVVGPYAYYAANGTIKLIHTFQGPGPEICPPGTKNDWHEAGSSLVLCYTQLQQ